METRRALFVGLVLLLLAVEFSLVVSKVDEKGYPDLDPKSNATKKTKSRVKGGGDVLVYNTDNKVHEENKSEKDQVNKKSQEDVKVGVDKNVVASKRKDGNVDEGQGDSSANSRAKEGGGDKEENSSGVGGGKVLRKEKGSEEETQPRKDSAAVEECDSSNKCTDEENKLVACLRVPGNESPDLSLLIQNKGKASLDVTISAPGFVQLEKTKIQLKQKEDKKVKVSIANVGSGSLIVLTAGTGHCNLDISDLIAHNFGKVFENSNNESTYSNFMLRTPTIAIISCGALLLLASGWMCFSLRQKPLSKNGSRYQKLEMELPATGGGKMESETTDAWDNSWGDDWDDEEAPKTPSMPVTPSVSSKGLASRRLSKEGWKD